MAQAAAAKDTKIQYLNLVGFLFFSAHFMDPNRFVAMRLLPALLGLSQCKKNDPNPVDQLPPATQTGANTFGCLVNGQPWLPQGYNDTSNYSISYDSGLNGGVFDLAVYRYDPGSPKEQNMILYANQMGLAKSYSSVALRGQEQALKMIKRTAIGAVAIALRLIAGAR